MCKSGLIVFLLDFYARFLLERFYQLAFQFFHTSVTFIAVIECVICVATLDKLELLVLFETVITQLLYN